MNYLAHGPELIKPITQIHPRFHMPFLAFLLNDGYLIDPQKTSRKKMVVHLEHPSTNRERIVIEKGNIPNEAAKKRYLLFLKMYAKHGKGFIEKLRAQIKIKNV
ncbi:hypothetical protein [Acinetobacter thermotolerans]|uniref:hypothetical protein n=1 Tax=Acinetobacter thermotolerans TaxID=3151487 RepID=UPI00325BFBE7